MDTNLLLAHHRTNAAVSDMVTANQFLQGARPLNEVLSIVDSGIVALHDAKAELVRFRDTVYNKHKQDLKEEAQDGLSPVS